MLKLGGGMLGDGKGADGRARTREVKLAVFFIQDKLDNKGYPVRDPDSSSYIASFEPAGVFAGLMEAEGIRRGAGHVRRFTIIGDGAAWTWNIATAKFPEATQIVDLYHARGHLSDLARSWSSCSATMRWTVAGADAIIALRCREASSTWEAICKRPRTQTGAA
jgi:hypothetical protein